MGCKKLLRRGVMLIVILILIVTGLFLRWQYVRQVELNSGSVVVDTAAGPIEYATFGEGLPVLVLHGTIGGYDQGLVIAQSLQTDDYQFIAVSRPGYLRTPLSTGDTFEAQADAYVALLDELNIEPVAIIAVSGGGPSAIQFALRHPDRLSGLVMLAANSDIQFGRVEPTKEASPPPDWVLNLMFSDFVSWLANHVTSLFMRQTASALIDAEYVDAVLNDEFSMQMLNGFLDSIDLMGMRRAGSYADGANMMEPTGNDWSTIETPTLIVQGTSDALSIIRQQQGLHEVLPNSEYVEIEGGTHYMIVSHYAEVSSHIAGFLESLEVGEDDTE